MTPADRPLVVAAIGGNALLHRGQPPEIDIQRANVRDAAAVLATLAEGHRLVITHGNGPQVGLLARQSEALAGIAPVPFDVLAAESEGLIGYLLVEELSRHLGADRVSVVLTRVVVDGADPAFTHPTKPIGAVMDRTEAERLAAQHGWTIAADGEHWRRVVASPEPLEIVEHDAIDLLERAGQVVICAGGGGIPVRRGDDGVLAGVEAVIDKDLTSALVAERLTARDLLILTDVDAVHEAWGTAQARPIRHATPGQLRSQPWPSGSMGPKVEAACRFVERTGGVARIGALGDAAAVLRGDAGTVVSSR
ncbi:MAG: carbamate kinase [Ilumatobacteraceae bacterium]|nr:carbamate kinase [Ilumatobacter sp.]MCB0985015.1 carbamate kinase [Ilumatobacter sp.]